MFERTRGQSWSSWSCLGAAALGIVALGWGASGTAKERAVVVAPQSADLAALQALEAKQTADLDQPSQVLALGNAYLAAHNPGLALRVVESSSASVRVNPAVEHLYARALFDQGRGSESLAAEKRVLEHCTPLGDVHEVTEIEGCDARTLVSATRRREYLERVLALGVEDPQAHPEASQVAYMASSREVRLAAR